MIFSSPRGQNTLVFQAAAFGATDKRNVLRVKFLPNAERYIIGFGNGKMFFFLFSSLQDELR